MNAQAEATQLRLANERLQAELLREQQLRHQAEEDREQLQNERTRLQRIRDELAKSVLAAEKRAAEAEEELASLAAQRAEAAQSSPAQARAPSLHRLPSRGDSFADDVEMLLEELDSERRAKSKLEKALQTAHAKLQKRGGGSGTPSGSSASLIQMEDTAERIAALKASWDKLIAALDAQSAEAERLSLENIALVEALHELQEISSSWETQAQEALAQSEQLKDLLEESAAWAPSGGATGTGPSSSEGEASSEPDFQRLTKEVLELKASNAKLQLQVRALCAELTRTAAGAAAARRALLPFLGTVESRLSSVLAMRARVAAA